MNPNATGRPGYGRLNMALCIGCGSRMAAGVLVKHKGSPACLAAALTKELQGRGLYLAGRSGKRYAGLGLAQRHPSGKDGQMQTWVPRWALDMVANGATDEQIAARATELGL